MFLCATSNLSSVEDDLGAWCTMVLIQFRDVSWTRRGESPVDLAVKEGHEEIVALMRAYELVANDPTFARELNSPPVPPPRPAHANTSRPTSPVTLTPFLSSLLRSHRTRRDRSSGR